MVDILKSGREGGGVIPPGRGGSIPVVDILKSGRGGWVLSLGGGEI